MLATYIPSGSTKQIKAFHCLSISREKIWYLLMHGIRCTSNEHFWNLRHPTAYFRFSMYTYRGTRQTVLSITSLFINLD